MIDVQKLLTEDENARYRIDHEVTTNFFVEASAGSGKTSKLVDRLLAMVLYGRSIENICAITFTKNAANEFYRRFVDRLRRELKKETWDELSRERLEAALRGIDLCFMGTIDAFCQMVISEHPSEAGIPPGTTVISEEELRHLVRSELIRTENGEYGEELSELLRQVRSVVYSADSLIEASAGFFLDRRDGELVRFAPEGNCNLDIDQSFKEEIRQLRATLKEAVAHPELIETGNDKARKAAEVLHRAEMVLRRDWNGNIAEVEYLLKTVAPLRLLTVPESLVEEPQEVLKEHTGKKKYYELTCMDPRHPGQVLGEMKYSLFMEFMPRFCAQLGRTLLREGKLRFFDCQLALLEMLRRDAAGTGQLIRHIQSRHSYYLIDEFQDTSPMQSEIFFFLTGTEIQPDWKRCCPAPGSLFLVGDPKQSIYRFRRADLQSYLEVRSLFVPPSGDVLVLYRNFRSTPTMISEFNRMFSALFPSEDTPVQCRYKDIPSPDHTADEGTSGVYTYRASQDPEEDAAAVADLIASLVGNPAISLRVNEDGKPLLRSPQYRDIMVITRKKQALGGYMDACMQRGIPVMVEGKTIFSRCPSLRALSSVLSAVVNPENPLKVYAALQGPLFHCSDGELLSYKENGGKLTLSHPDVPVPPGAVGEAVRKMEPLVAEARNTPFTELFGRALEMLPVLERCGTEQLEYLFFARELLRDREAQGILSGNRAAADYLECLLADEENGLERSLSFSSEENRVHFANLHKVKGLEAPVVILADPRATRAKKPSCSTMRDAGGVKHMVFSVRNGNYPALSTAGAEEEQERESELQKGEGDRLLYVAATRAGNLLILADPGKNGPTSSWGTLLPFADGDISALTGDWRTPPPQNGALDVNAVMEDGRSQGRMIMSGRNEKSFTTVRPSSGSGSGHRLSGAVPDSEDSVSGIDRARYLGTAVHRLMERLVRGGDRCGTEDLCKSVLKEFDRPPQISEEEAFSILSAVAETMTRGGFPQSNGTVQDLLDELAKAEEIHCELPFCSCSGSELVNGVMDLVYRKAGKWHIIDYKTSADSAGQAQYATQLDHYVRAFITLSGETADAAIYQIDLNVGGENGHKPGNGTA